MRLTRSCWGPALILVPGSSRSFVQEEGLLLSSGKLGHLINGSHFILYEEVTALWAPTCLCVA